MDKQNMSHCKVFGIQLCLKKRLLVSACCILLFFFLPSPQLPSSPCLPSQQVAGLGHAECTPTYKVFLNLAFMCAQLFSHVWLFVTPMDCSSSGSSVHGISQATMLGWVAVSFSRGSSQPRNQTCVSSISCIASRFFITKPPGKSAYTSPL